MVETYVAPKVKVGDKIRLIGRVTDSSSRYIGSIWRITKLSDSQLYITEITGPSPLEHGSISILGPWRYEKVTEDWDE